MKNWNVGVFETVPHKDQLKEVRLISQEKTTEKTHTLAPNVRMKSKSGQPDCLYLKAGFLSKATEWNLGGPIF